MTPMQQYLDKCRGLMGAVADQQAMIERAADRSAATILAGRTVHVFGRREAKLFANFGAGGGHDA